MNLIKKQAFLSTIYSYGGVLIGFVSQFFLIGKYLEPAENGLLAVLLAYMYVLVQISSLGFNAAGSRFFPQFRDAKNGHNGFLFLGIAICFIGFFLTIIGLLFLKDYLVSNRENSLLFADNFYLLLPLTFATLFFNLLDNYAKNLYDTVTGTFLSQFLQKTLVLISLLLIVFRLVDFHQFIYIWAFAFSLYIVPMFWKVSKLEGFSLKPNFSILTPTFSRQFAWYSFLTILTGFSSMIIVYIDKFMLAKWTTLGETGIYNTAAFFGSVMGMSLIALNKATQPLISDAFAVNDYDKISTIYRKSCTTSLIVGCWIFLGICLNIDNLFLFLKPEYAAGKWVVIIICLGKLFDLATGINSIILSLSKYYFYDTYIIISLIVITVLLNLILIPIYGMNGAAIALAVATIYFNLVRYIIVWWKLGMQPFTFDLIKIIFISAAIGLIIKYLPNIDGSVFMRVSDIAYRSFALTLLYGIVIYWSKISPELNGAMKNSWLILMKFLR